MSEQRTSQMGVGQHPAWGRDVASAHRPQPDIAYVTKYTSATGPVVKRFTLVGDQVEVAANARIHTGQACTLRANDPEELKEALDGLGANEAVGLGVLATVDQSVPLDRQHEQSREDRRPEDDRERGTAPHRGT